jgi:transcriptional regulator CtsR
LTTRFTTGHGYVVESRRGGGGYIRIMKIPLEQGAEIIINITDLIGSSISQHEAEGLLDRLVEEELISNREARIMQAAVARYPQLMEAPSQEKLRAAILKAMLTSILKN